MSLMMLGGVAVTFPLVILENIYIKDAWLAQVNIQHVAGIICLSIFPSVLAFQFWNQALDKIPANKVAIFQYLIPVYTVVISLLFLGESLQMFQLIGGTLILAGVILVTNKPGQRRDQPEKPPND